MCKYIAFFVCFRLGLLVLFHYVNLRTTYTHTHTHTSSSKDSVWITLCHITCTKNNSFRIITLGMMWLTLSACFSIDDVPATRSAVILCIVFRRNFSTSKPATLFVSLGTCMLTICVVNAGCWFSVCIEKFLLSLCYLIQNCEFVMCPLAKGMCILIWKQEGRGLECHHFWKACLLALWLPCHVCMQVCLTVGLRVMSSWALFGCGWHKGNEDSDFVVPLFSWKHSSLSRL